MESLKPGDKVRLKKLDHWVTEEAAMTVKHVGDFSALGVVRGALCEWMPSRGTRYEKIYALDDLIPL